MQLKLKQNRMAAAILSVAFAAHDLPCGLLSHCPAFVAAGAANWDH